MAVSGQTKTKAIGIFFIFERTPEVQEPLPISLVSPTLQSLSCWHHKIAIPYTYIYCARHYQGKT